MKISIKDLKICFSILLLTIFTSCSTTSLQIGREKWIVPKKPEMRPVVITSIPDSKIEESGYYLSVDNAENLSQNVIDLKAYTEKLEILINQMKEYYSTNDK